MGDYYELVCPRRKERIEPGDICDEVNEDGNGIKLGPFVLNHTMQIAACYAIRGPWAGETMMIVADNGLGGEFSENDFKNVTEDAIRLFVEEFPDEAEEWKLRHVSQAPKQTVLPLVEEFGILEGPADHVHRRPPLLLGYSAELCPKCDRDPGEEGTKPLKPSSP